MFPLGMRQAFFSVDFMKLEMPALSPTMTDGTIAKWMKKEGDKIDVGDVLCDITTDKATIGYDSQEEGYLAKILSKNGDVMAIGGLIGIMVENESDIAKLDMSQIQTGVPPPKVDTTSAVVVEQPKSEAASSVGTESFFEELDHMLHGGSYKVAPAAGWWMRTYKILPTEVKATGPKGYIVKADVLAHIESNKLEKGKRVGGPAKE